MSSERSGRRREQVDDIVVHDCVRASCDAAKCTQAQGGATLEQKNLAVCCSCSATLSEYMPASTRCTHCRPRSHQEKEMATRGPDSSCSANVVPCVIRSSAPSLISCLPESKQPTEEEEDGGGCITPKAQEHRIPNPPAVCPPPPHKKRRKLIKRTVDMIDRNTVAADTAAPSPSDEPRWNERHIIGTSFFSAPSDLHTYPEIIRALFKS